MRFGAKAGNKPHTPLVGDVRKNSGMMFYGCHMTLWNQVCAARAERTRANPPAPGDTPAQLAVMPDLTGHHWHMAGSNAGKKRNVFARRDPEAWRWEALFSSFVKQQVNTAATESGDYSPGLYLELFIREYVAEHGSLPVLSEKLPADAGVMQTQAA